MSPTDVVKLKFKGLLFSVLLYYTDDGKLHQVSLNLGPARHSPKLKGSDIVVDEINKRLRMYNLSRESKIQKLQRIVRHKANPDLAFILVSTVVQKL